MDVAGLVERLNKFSPTAKVRLGSKEGEELLFVMSSESSEGKDISCVWFEGESDVDLSDILNTSFLKSEIEGLDKSLLYKELLKAGVTVDMVRRYVGDEYADQMNLYCHQRMVESEVSYETN